MNSLIRHLPLLSSLASLLLAAPAAAQHYQFRTDGSQRGYYDRPWLRYEAEPDLCASFQGETLAPPSPYSQAPLQADASRQTAITLAAQGDFVEWTADAEANALSLRFSLPDSPDGKGTKSTVAFYAGDEKLADIDLDSYWAWQYTQIAYSQDKYPDNIPDDSKFARMRFDEVYKLLDRAVAQGEKFRIVRESGDVPVTIDFIELEMAPEPVSFNDIEGEKVLFDGSVGLQQLINNNPGKTIFIAPGTYNLPRRIIISSDNTKIVGAGIWYSYLYFNAAPDKRNTFSQRGFESNANGLLFEGFSVNTANNQRYFENNPNNQVGKGFQGSLGSNSTIRNVRVDHFECGAWIADYNGVASRNLTVEHCRFRNNYADGINLCTGTQGARVAHCSFRNNGDDDMAIWSTSNGSHNNIYEYNSADCNWRASSLAIYGGRDNKARYIHIADAMEEGLHINGEFRMTGFEGTTEVSEVTIERAGDKGGTPGQHGGFWGSASPALHVRGGYFAPVKNVEISHVDIFDSRYRAIGISSNSSKAVNNVKFNYIHVDGVADNEWGLYVDNSAVGDASYENYSFVNVTTPAVGNGSRRFTLTDLGNSAVDEVASDSNRLSCSVSGGKISIAVLRPGAEVSLFSSHGFAVGSATAGSDGRAVISAPAPGFYVIRSGHLSLKLTL